MIESSLRILIVDDDPEIRSAVALALKRRDIACEGANSTKKARTLLTSTKAFDLILLDIQMDEVNGLDFLHEIRTRGIETPVILLTGLDSLEHKLRGFETGADDYVTKPFHPRELLARIEAVVRRRRAVPVITMGDLELHPSTRTLHRGEARIGLSPREFDLVRVLMQAQGNPVMRKELLREIWSLDFEPGTSVVEVLVSRVRRKLESGSDTRLNSAPGKGYWLATGSSHAI